jgi:hypothetical protein
MAANCFGFIGALLEVHGSNTQRITHGDTVMKAKKTKA